MKVLDLGAGEGKNAVAFARRRAAVTAVEISEAALNNGRISFPAEFRAIDWRTQRAEDYQFPKRAFDVVICYGLIHCLKSIDAAAYVLRAAQDAVIDGGCFILATFNDGSHDLSAHPGFKPLLIKHAWFVEQFLGWDLETCSDERLYETHPHNSIPHHHTITRILAYKRDGHNLPGRAKEAL